MFSIYTDGSTRPTNPGQMGAGIVIYASNVTKPIMELSIPLGHGTNNQAEMLAIYIALTHTVELPSITTTIYTDSKYCWGLLTQGWNAKTNKDLVEKTRALLATKTNIFIKHIRGHQGIEGNEIADKLAYTACIHDLS